MAKPPDTAALLECTSAARSAWCRTEELFAASALLDDLDEARLQLFDRRNVVCENAHLALLGRDVDLDAAENLAEILGQWTGGRSGRRENVHIGRFVD